MIATFENGKFICHRSSEQASASLVLFPFVGGSAIVYKTWLEQFPAFLDVFSVQMPGRGTRTSEPFCQTVDQIVDDLIESLYTLTDKPLFFFGHSLGGRVAYACCKRLYERQQALPQMIFISASKSPNTVNRRRLSDLNDADLLEELTLHGGIPDELLGQVDMLNYFMPTIRADMTLFENYHCQGKPLPTSLTLLGGQEDSLVSYSQLYGWVRYFNYMSECKLFPGGHFYINDQCSLLIDFLAEKITAHIKAATV